MADGSDDQNCGVELRMGLPSSIGEQKARTQIIRTSLGVVKKMIGLKDAGADLEATKVVQWLESFDSIGKYFEKLSQRSSLSRTRSLLGNLF